MGRPSMHVIDCIADGDSFGNVGVPLTDLEEQNTAQCH